jgi:hypothetical protein
MIVMVCCVMFTKTPLQESTPFAIAGKPMRGTHSAQAGLCVFSRAVRSLGLPMSCDESILIKKRKSGFTPGQTVESLSLLYIPGGDGMQGIEQLRTDSGVQRMLGYTTPSQRTVGCFLESFHDTELIEQARNQTKRRDQLSFIPERPQALEGLGLSGLVKRYTSTFIDPVTFVTVDQDATIIESTKRQTLYTYEGTRGYQPMYAAWAGTGLILADEFRGGKVPAASAPLKCAQAAFTTLQEIVTEYYFGGYSACHESGLINWLRNPQRKDGPLGFIGFVVSAWMSGELRRKLESVHETRRTTISTGKDGTLRQWVEVAFVPGKKTEKKNIIPLRYIGLRLLKPQVKRFLNAWESFPTQQTWCNLSDREPPVSRR